MERFTLVRNMIETLRPRTLSAEEWVGWLLNSGATDAEINQEIHNMASVVLGPTLGGSKDYSPFGLGHPSIFQILSLFDSELEASDGSNLERMLSKTFEIHLAFSLKAQAAKGGENIMNVSIRSAEVLTCSSLLLGLLETLGKLDGSRLVSSDWDISVHQILAFQIHNTLASICKLRDQKVPVSVIVQEIMPIAIHGTQIAQKFACNEPLEFHDWDAVMRSSVQNSKDAAFSRDLFAGAVERLAPNLDIAVKEAALKESMKIISKSSENGERLVLRARAS